MSIGLKRAYEVVTVTFRDWTDTANGRMLSLVNTAMVPARNGD